VPCHYRFVQRIAAVTSLESDALAAAYSVPSADEWRAGRWVRVNFVMSLDGSIVGSEGLSRSLGTEADRAAFWTARGMADVLLVGAQTIRSEDYRPSPIPVAIVTASLDLDPGLRMFAERTPEHARPVVLTTHDRATQAPQWLREVADVLSCGSEAVDLAQAVSLLVARGWPRILCEGGPMLLEGLIEHDLVDELLLTLAPRLVGSSRHLVTHLGGWRPPRRLVPSLVVEHEGTVLTRYRRP